MSRAEIHGPLAQLRDLGLAPPRVPGRDLLKPTLNVELTYSKLMEGRLRDPVYRGLA